MGTGSGNARYGARSEIRALKMSEWLCLLLSEEIRAKVGRHTDFDFVMPVGLFLVLNRATGGGLTGDELVRRFHLLHAESKNAIDFYFLGWRWRDPDDRSRGIKFHLKSFEECRNELESRGVKGFPGSAGLILVDVWYRYRNAAQDLKGRPSPHGYSEIEFNFPEAVRINLATSREQKRIPPIGDFLQSIIAASEELQRDSSTNPVFAISDKLGIAVAKQSILDFLLAKCGKIIGADKLAVLAVRNVGPVVRLYGDRVKDNALTGDMPALSLPRGVDPSNFMDN